MHRHGCVIVVHITKKVMMLIFSVNTLLAGSALPAHPISSYYRTPEVKLSDMVPPTGDILRCSMIAAIMATVSNDQPYW